MKRKNKKFQKKGSNSLNKLSLFQKNDGKFSKKCPLSIKNAPIIDYKNINLLKKYMSDNGKIMSSKITSVSFNKQKKLTKEIKKYNKGFYIHYKFEGNKETLSEINKKVKIDGSIIRHLTVKYKKLDTDSEYFKKDK